MTTFSLVRKDEPLAMRKLFVVLFGQPGVGKTTLSFTMFGRVLHLDFDHGIDRAHQRIRPDYFKIDTFDEFSKFLYSSEFKELAENYDSVVIDTIGTLLDDFLAPYLIRLNPKNGSGGSLTLKGWGALSQEFSRIKTRLQSECGLHVCAISHEKEEGDGDARQYRLAVKGSSTDIVYRSCDMLGYMSIVGRERTVDFNPTQAHVGKNMIGIEATTLPDPTGDAYPDFLAKRVIQAALDKMATLSDDQKAIQDLIASYREMIDNTNTPSEFSLLYETIKEESSVVAKVQIKKLFGQRMKELGIKYDGDKRDFVYIDGRPDLTGAVIEEPTTQLTPSGPGNANEPVAETTPGDADRELFPEKDFDAQLAADQTAANAGTDPVSESQDVPNY